MTPIPEMNDPVRLERAAKMVKITNTLIISASMLGIAAWFTNHLLLFYISGGIASGLVIPMTWMMVAKGLSRSGQGVISISILMIIIGILITKGFWSGLLLGGSFYGIYTMAPIALHILQTDWSEKKLAETRDKLDKNRKELYAHLEDDKNRIERIEYLSEQYDKLYSLVQTLRSNMDDFEIYAPEVEKLRDYLSSGKWKEDFEADERGEIPQETNRSILSEDGLFNLLESLDDLLCQFDDALELLWDEKEEETVSETQK